MAKAVIDARDAATLDAVPQSPDDVLEQIAGEEQAENDAIREAVEKEAQDAAEAERAELISGWQIAMRKVAGVLTAAVKDLKPIWTDEQMDDIGEALAGCDEHYGWGGAGRLIGHPLVALGVASAPVAVGTYFWWQGKKEEIAATRLAQRRQMTASPAGVAAELAAAPAAAPGEKVDTKAAPPSGKVPNIAAVVDRALAADTFAP